MGANLTGATLMQANLTKAYLMGATLMQANLTKAYLMGANLTGANLTQANLMGASLTQANLTWANLTGANLTGANLTQANLTNADLMGANLTRANLTWANLTWANLTGANLTQTNLTQANLTGVRTDYLTVGTHAAPEGDLIGWKKLNNGTIAKLRIPAAARRSCATTRKHRAEWVVVLEGEGDTEAIDRITHYAPGLTVTPDKWDNNRWRECSNGIHFFLTREEAEAWN
jgi:hypothetical protein